MNLLARLNSALDDPSDPKPKRVIRRVVFALMLVASLIGIFSAQLFWNGMYPVIPCAFIFLSSGVAAGFLKLAFGILTRNKRAIVASSLLLVIATPGLCQCFNTLAGIAALMQG